jgi:hypothetical protein
VADYWIVNLVKHQLEVYRQPIEDDEATYGWRYGGVVIYRPGQVVVPLSLVDQSVRVEDLLP